MTTNFHDIFIISGGNVGIGNTNPTNKLTITGTLSTSSSSYFGGASTFAGTLSVGGDTQLANTFATSLTLQNGLSVGQIAYVSKRLEMGSNNVAIGNSALSNNSSSYNVAVGYRAGLSAISGSHTFVGYQAGEFTDGDQNIGVGYQSLGYVSGSHNLGAGNESMFEVIGHDNVALGASGGKKLVGSRNIVVGNFAAISGAANRTIAIGYQAGKSAVTSKSVMIGYQAGLSCTGHDNVFLGYQAGSLRKTADDTLVIGNENAELIYGNFTSGEMRVHADLTISGNTTFIDSQLSIAGRAPMYGVRAWATFNGYTNVLSNLGIFNSHNVTSITKDGSNAKYTLTFTESMPTNTYAVAVCTTNGSGDGSAFGKIHNYTTNLTEVMDDTMVIVRTNRDGSLYNTQDFISVIVIA